MDQWRVSLLRFTRVLAGHADQSFRSADLVLNAVREDLADIRFDTAEFFRLLDRERVLPALNLRANASEQIASISIYDTGGGLLIDLMGAQTMPTIEFARSDVSASLAAKGDMPFISEATINGATGASQVFLTRPLFNSDNFIIGAVSVLLREEFFTNFYRRLDFTGVVRMTRDDGVTLTQYPRAATRLAGPCAPRRLSSC